MEGKTFKEILNAIGNSLSNLGSSDSGENWEDEEADREDFETDKLSQDDKPGWVMATISKTGQRSIERVR